MKFQFDKGKKRRHVEGYNCVSYGVDDQIDLSAKEYMEIGFDFYLDDMNEEAIESFLRSIGLGSVESMRHLGQVYERQNHLEKAYFWYLEGSLNEDPKALDELERLYKNGIYVPKNKKRAFQLWNLSKKLIRNRKCHR